MDKITPPSTSRAPRILFVDDSRLMRACAHKILADSFDLVLARDAAQAWRMLQEDPEILVVFTDINMPGCSGYDLLGRIRGSERRELADLPVVVITGSEGDEDERLYALTQGATDFINKPFTASEMHARARAYAAARRSWQRLRALEQAHHFDQESGLGNRRHCRERLAQAMSFAGRHGQELALLHLRLPGLAQLAGAREARESEPLPQQVAQWLKRAIRREDSVFRTGTDTFTFVLPATPEKGARTLQRRLIPAANTHAIASVPEFQRIDAEFRLRMLTGADPGDAGHILDEDLDNWLPDIAEFPIDGTEQAGLNGHFTGGFESLTAIDDRLNGSQAEDSAPSNRNAPLLQPLPQPEFESR